MNHTIIEQEKLVHLMSTTEPKELLTRIESISNLKFNLQYSLRLIEASLEYLIMTTTEEDHMYMGSSEKAIRELVSSAFINADSEKYPCTKEMIKELLKDHERIITQLQKRVKLAERNKDPEATRFVISMIEEHQNIAGKFRRSF
jgi:hypothetical protein